MYGNIRGFKIFDISRAYCFKAIRFRCEILNSIFKIIKTAVNSIPQIRFTCGKKIDNIRELIQKMIGVFLAKVLFNYIKSGCKC